MLESILALTDLPNLHPAVVHLPIALVLTALLLDMAACVARGATWLDRAGTTLWMLATAGCWAAVVSGEAAAEAMVGLPGLAQAALADHDTAAMLAAILTSAAAALRIIVSWQGRRDKRIVLGGLRVVTLLAAVGAVALVVRAADLGGSLVYRHGLGVVQGQTVHDRPTPADDQELLEP